MHIPEALQGSRFRPLSVDEVNHLIEAGAFDGDERIELLHGMLVVGDMSDGDIHVALTQRLMKQLVLATLDLPLEVYCQSSAQMGTYQLPSPDIVVAPRPAGLRRPVGGLLVAEVADTSLDRDQTIKAPIYAAANVPEYWVVDVNGQQVFVHTSPEGDTYRSVEVVPRTGVLRPRAIPGLEIVVDDLFRTE